MPYSLYVSYLSTLSRFARFPDRALFTRTKYPHLFSESLRASFCHEYPLLVSPFRSGLPSPEISQFSLRVEFGSFLSQFVRASAAMPFASLHTFLSILLEEFYLGLFIEYRPLTRKRKAQSPGIFTEQVLSYQLLAEIMVALWKSLAKQSRKI